MTDVTSAPPLATRKNWKQICELGNIHLKLCVALSEDEELLSKLQIAFPELFQEESNGFSKFSLAVVREQFGRYWKGLEGDSAESILQHKLYLPIVFGAFGERLDDDPEVQISLTPDIVSRFEGLRLMTEGAENAFPFKLHEVTINGTRYYLGYVWTEDLPGSGDIVLWPADLFIVDVE